MRHLKLGTGDLLAFVALLLMVLDLELVLGAHAAKHAAVGDIDEAVNATQATVFPLHTDQAGRSGEEGGTECVWWEHQRPAQLLHVRGGKVYLASDATVGEGTRHAVDDADEAEAAVDGIDHAPVAARVLEVELVLQEAMIDVDRRWRAQEGLAAKRDRGAVLFSCTWSS